MKPFISREYTVAYCYKIKRRGIGKFLGVQRGKKAVFAG